MTLAFHLALRRVDLVSLRFDDIIGDRIVSAIRKTDTQARDIEATNVDFPIHPDVRRAIAKSRRSSIRMGRCPYIIHRPPERITKRMSEALAGGARASHTGAAWVCVQGFSRARLVAAEGTSLFVGLAARELPTLHEIRFAPLCQSRL